MITLTILGILLLVGIILLFVLALPLLDIAFAALVIGLIIYGIVKLVQYCKRR